MATRTTSILALVAYLVAVTILLAFCYARPSYNWDMLAYSAVVLDDGSISREDLHAKVYAVASREVPEEEYRMLVDTTHQLRKEVLRNPEKFYQFLSYFRVKPLYTGMSSALFALGVPLLKSTILPSAIAVFVLAWLLFFRFSRTFPLWAAGMLGLSVLCAPPVIEAARLSTPDALSTVILVGAFLVYLDRANVYGFMLLIALAVLARLDNVILGTVLLLSLFFLDDKARGGRVVALAVVGLIALFIAYSWLILRHAEYGNGFEAFYGGLARKWNPLVLVGDALQGIKTLQTSYVAIGGITFVVLFYRSGFRLTGMDRSRFLFVAVTIAFLVRYVLFPDLTTRFFLSYYILCWILVMEAVSGAKEPPSTSTSRNR